MICPEIRIAEIRDFDGYKRPVKQIKGYVMLTTHRTEETARKAAAKDGSIAFILCWVSEVGNPVFGLMITEEMHYTRKAEILRAQGKDDQYALIAAKEAAERLK